MDKDQKPLILIWKRYLDVKLNALAQCRRIQKMKLFEEINSLSVLLMVVIVINVFIFGCGEDEEGPVEVMNLLKDSVSINPEESGPPVQIVWTKINEDGSHEELKEFEAFGKIKHRSTFIVRILDANGDPVPDERVEWTLNTWPDEVGDIVDTDDPGHRNIPEVQAAPQIKVDNKFAITFTNSENSIPSQLKGMGENGEIVIRKGETWISINSTREGGTGVSAFATAIPRNGEHPYEIFGVTHWVDLDWIFPESAINPINFCEVKNEHTFVTKLRRISKPSEVVSGVKVRYSILSGSDAIWQNGGKVIEVMSDENGEAKAAIELIHIEGGENQILVEILPRNDMEIFTDKEFVIASTTVTKKWAWELEELYLTTPENAVFCLEYANIITGIFSVKNDGLPSAKNVRLIVDYPVGITVVDTNGGSNNGDKITWNIGMLAPNATVSSTPIFAAGNGGVYTFTAIAESECVVAEPVTWTVKIIELIANCLFSPTIIDLDPGERFDFVEPSNDPRYIADYILIVENIGGETVNATLRLRELPAGIKFVSGDPETITLATGNTFEKTFQLKGTASGIYTLEGTVDISSATDSSIICNPLSTLCDVEVVGLPAMQIEIIDTSDPINVNQLTRYRMVIWNEGTDDAYDVTIVNYLPPKMRLVREIEFLTNNPYLDPRDLYLDPSDPGKGLHPENVVVCGVELVVVDYTTGDVDKDPIHNPELAAFKWDWSFDQGDLPINIAGIPEVLDGNTTLALHATDSEITFAFDRIIPTWAFRISFYAQAKDIGTVVNRTDLTYREKLDGPITPSIRSDEPTTIR